LTQDAYDVLVVGAGIHGLFAAYDAAARGFRVAIVDRADIGGGVSANHQRTVHGGLRELRSGNINKVRTQIAERRAWARIAPALLRPLPFLMGTYRTPLKSRTAIRVGFAAYDLLARKRNAGVTPELHLPKGRLESAAATRRLFAGIRDAGLTGGAMWYDYQTASAERLTFAVAEAAVAAGATLVNYIVVDGPNARQAGVRATDALSGESLEIAAKVVILAAAEGLPALHAAFGLPAPPPLIHAMNVLVDRPAMDMAHVAPSASGRMLTAVPWRGYVLVGTAQGTQEAAPGTRATEADIDAFLSDANAAFPKLKVTRADVRLVQEGLVPAARRGGQLDLLPDFEVRQDAAQPSCISIVGAKYTTARLAAERAIDRAAKVLGQSGRRCRTATAELPHAGIADVEGQLIETARELEADLPLETQRHLGRWYADAAADVLRFAHASPWGLSPLVSDSPVLAAEIAYARAHLMAMTVEDAIYRRTALGGTGRVSPEAAAAATAVFEQSAAVTDSAS
jgi:glycerol-3-phosphate dehydrogenase